MSCLNGCRKSKGYEYQGTNGLLKYTELGLSFVCVVHELQIDFAAGFHCRC